MQEPQRGADTLFTVERRGSLAGLAGPPAPAFAWMLWKERGDTATILDLGSILDGYTHERYGGPVSKGAALTRSFWRKRATMDILKRNLTGK